MSETGLTRSDTDKMVAGVCGGIAAYLNLDSVLIRLAFVLLALASGIGVVIYVIMWLVMPRESSQTTSEAEVVQNNIKDLQETVSSGAARMGKPATIGLVLMMLGVYFLLTQLGIVGWLRGAVLPLFIVAIAGFLLWQWQRA